MRTIKQFLITVSALLCCITAKAYDFEVDGIYYNVLSTSDFTAQVTSGDNKYYGDIIIPESVVYKSKVLKVTSIGYGAFQQCYNLTNIVIPKSVTNIGNYAFQSCIMLKSISIHNSVTSIGNNAFFGCSGLKSVTIPNSVTSIGERAFYNCTGLTNVTIGSSVTSIGGGAFSECDGLTSITIPNSVTSIGGGAFRGCSSLEYLCIEDGEGILSMGNEIFNYCPLRTLYLGRNLSYSSTFGDNPFFNKASLKSVTIGNCVTSIGKYEFSGCTGLRNISIGNSVTSIGKDAFEGCTDLATTYISDLAAWCNIDFYDYNVNPARNLYLNEELVTNLVIPDGVTEIKSYAFYYCASLTSITIPNSVTSIGNYAFEGCSGLTSVTIPNSVTSISEGAFAYCTGLNSVTIPNSVTSIGNSAFSCCSGLTSITIPNSVTSIGGWAFYYCTGLTSITIPNSVTSIGSQAFSYCDALTSIYLLGEIPPSANNSFDQYVYTYKTLYVPTGSLKTYQNADTWKNFQNIQEFDVTGIKNADTSNITIKVTANGISLYNAEDAKVVIYTLDGALVKEINNYTGREIVLDKGVHLVRVNENTIKIKL